MLHDDRVEALAMAVGYWVVHMSRDTDKAAEEHQEALRDQELERFKEHVFGIPKPKDRGWLDIDGM